MSKHNPPFKALTEKIYLTLTVENYKFMAVRILMKSSLGHIFWYDFPVLIFHDIISNNHFSPSFISQSCFNLFM